MTNLFLHRNDLRIKDNHGLVEAADGEEAVPVYAIDPEFWNFYGHNRKAYILELLERLQQSYRDLGSDLRVRKGDTRDVLQKAAEDMEADKVYYNRHYVPEHREAERKIYRMGLESEGFKDRVLVEPEELEKEYSSMSEYYEDWKKAEKPRKKGESENLAEFQDRKFDADTFDIQPTAELPPAGPEAARERWMEFRDSHLESYRDERDDVTKPGAVSRMGFHLSHGSISIREVFSDVKQIIDDAEKSTVIRNVAKYRYELAWREFMYHVMFRHPETVAQNYREFENEIPWRNDPGEIEAWKHGKTGVPFVDAGMRQLRQEGYMHNRLRQNVASFLTKHLLSGWRTGEEHFREHLFDHDTANNVGGWQWSASTGTDTVPVRIFNPVKQGRKYDERAEYIKKHVEELRPLTAEEIHDWVELDEAERNRLRREKEIDYPSPVVDLQSRREEAEKMFENAL